MADITNPHDRFFKEIFSRREVASDFLNNYLPSDVCRCIDTESIVLLKDSFIDKELGVYLSDLLYEVRLTDGSDAYVYVLFEHKSFPDTKVAFQLLRYIIRIWELAFRQKQFDTLPPVIPVVIYHGVTEWRISRKFSSLLDVPTEIEPFVPEFRYVLCDLSVWKDEDIKGMILLRVTLLLLKYIKSDKLKDRLPGIFGLLKELSSMTTGLEYLQTVLVYLSRGTDKINRQDLKDALTDVFQDEGGQIMPTIAEEWIREGFEKGVREGMQKGIQQGMQQGMEQGMQQGMQQGMEQGVRQGLLIAIKLGLELKFGAKALKIYPEIKKIRDADILEVISDAIRHAQTLDDVRAVYRS